MVQGQRHHALEQRIAELENDLAEKSRLVEHIARSEQKYRHIFEHSPAAVYLSDEDGMILGVNKAWEKLFGLSSRKDIVGKNSGQILFEDPHARDRYRDFLEKRGFVERFETRMRRNDDTIMDVEITASVRWGDNGVENFEGFVTDITARKDAERALQISEEKYRTVVENSLTAIFVHQRGRFTYVNRRFVEMLGYDRSDDLLGRSFWGFVHPDDREMVKNRGLKRQDGDFSPNQYIFRALKKDDSVIWVELRATHSTYLGNPAVVGNFIDITKRKRAEEEIRYLSRRLIEAIEEEKKRIAADLHDEFGQGLTSLHFDLDALRGSIPEEWEELRNRCGFFLNRIETMADCIRETIADLRPSILDHLGLIPTLESAVSEFSGRRPEMRIAFQTAGFKRRLPMQTEIVLYRIFQECLNNISKHAEAGNVDISLICSHPWVIFVVKDDGRGFTQDENGLPRTGVTTGIGMLSMRERVASLRGSIDISSAPGRGTAIRIKLPLPSGNADEKD